MDYFPIFIDTKNRDVLFIGGGEDIGHKLLLLGKSAARRHVFGAITDTRITAMIAAGDATHHRRPLTLDDTESAALAYIGTDDAAERDAAMVILNAAGVPYCVIDDRERSRFITPAVVDRDPVVVAIGSSGTAPVLARLLKSRIEGILPGWLGWLAERAEALRPRLQSLPKGTLRRQVWMRFFEDMIRSGQPGQHLGQDARPGQPGQDAPHGRDSSHLEARLDHLIKVVRSENSGSSGDSGLSGADKQYHPVRFVSAGPGDPDLLTRTALKALDDADIVLHDRLVPAALLELCRREAVLIETGKTGFGSATPQDAINRLMIAKATEGLKVVRLKSGDAGLFGRLDEEIAALDAVGIGHDVIPGVTSAVAAAARMGASLTRRGRNSSLIIATGHDVKGYAEHDWRNLAKPGAVAAIYMGIKALPFIQGRLLMYGAAPSLEVTLAERVSHPDEKLLATTLGRMVDDARSHGIKGPAVIMLGLHPHQAAGALGDVKAAAGDVKAAAGDVARPFQHDEAPAPRIEVVS